MELKLRLQRVLQILEDSERSGAMSELEKDMVLAELREAYLEVKFGAVLDGSVAPVLPTPEPEPVAEDDEPEVEEEEPEMEVEIIFNEDDDEDEVIEESAVEPEQENVADEEHHNAIMSLYEEGTVTTIGEQFHEAPSVADTIACPTGVVEASAIASLRDAIGVADKFMLVRELFNGDNEAYESAITALDSQPSLDDCVIYIAENYTWSPNGEGTKLVMELLQRKYNA